MSWHWRWPPVHIGAGAFEADFQAAVEEPAGDDAGRLIEEGHQGQFTQQNDGFLVVSPPDGGILDLPEIGESEEVIRVELQGRGTPSVELPVDLGTDQVVGALLVVVQPEAEMELGVAHHAGIRVRKGQVANVGLVRLRELDVTRVDGFYGLTQLQVEGHHADSVDPRG